jgi:hypothetical protein
MSNLIVTQNITRRSDRAVVPRRPPAEPDDAGGPVDVDGVSTLDLGDADVSAIVWCTGFTGDCSWVRLPVLDAAGQPIHDGGATREPGVWFVGLTWLSRRRSGILLGFPDTAELIADRVARVSLASGRPTPPSASVWSNPSSARGCGRSGGRLPSVGSCATTAAGGRSNVMPRRVPRRSSAMSVNSGDRHSPAPRKSGNHWTITAALRSTPGDEV